MQDLAETLIFPLIVLLGPPHCRVLCVGQKMRRVLLSDSIIGTCPTSVAADSRSSLDSQTAIFQPVFTEMVPKMANCYCPWLPSWPPQSSRTDCSLGESTVSQTHERRPFVHLTINLLIVVGFGGWSGEGQELGHIRITVSQ